MSGSGSPFSIPPHTETTVCPELMRFLNTSRCKGFENSLIPASFQVQPTSSRTSVCSVSSPAVSTMISIGLPSGISRVPSPLRRTSPISSRSAFAASRSNCAQRIRYSSSYSGHFACTVSFPSVASPK